MCFLGDLATRWGKKKVKNKFLVLCVILLINSCTISYGKTIDKKWLPYCGLYCVYTVIKLHDNINFNSLVKPAYCGSANGSTIDELYKASVENGYHALMIRNGTFFFLQHLKDPIILHVRANIYSSQYTHYIVAYKCSKDKIQIFDPSSSDSWKWIDLRTLEFLWDGTGLLVTKKALNNRIFFASWLYSISIIVILAIIWIMFKCIYNFKALIFLKSKYKLVTKPLIQLAILLNISISWSMIFNLISYHGILCNSQGVETVQKSQADTFLNKIKLSDLENDIKNSDTILIDARMQQDFNRGHIMNAVNIPITVSEKMFMEKIKGIDKESKIIVYCQSNMCSYASSIARKFTSTGFNNIYIYKDGWIGWKKSHP